MSSAAQTRIHPVSNEITICVAAIESRARTRIAGAFAGRPEMMIRVGSSARELIEAAPTCDVLVFHCEAVSTNELTLFGELTSRVPELLIVVVCESADVKNARRAVDKGVEGLVFAERLGDALTPTVEAVLAGQTVVPQGLRASVRKPSLSFREKQILGMVVMGFTNAEIGARLFLAESTIKSHLSSAFSKLGVRSRSEAAAMILDPHGSLGTGILAITSNDWNPPAD